MTSFDVVDFYRVVSNVGVEIWIDGGWGVDALLGDQTRPHSDLDIAIQEKDIPVLRQLVEARGYSEIKLDIARPWNFVLGDENGREIDVHVIVFDEKGNGIYGPRENGEMYPAASLTGTGQIEGHTVRCNVCHQDYSIGHGGAGEDPMQTPIDRGTALRKIGL